MCGTYFKSFKISMYLDNLVIWVQYTIIVYCTQIIIVAVCQRLTRWMWPQNVWIITLEFASCLDFFFLSVNLTLETFLALLWGRIALWFWLEREGLWEQSGLSRLPPQPEGEATCRLRPTTDTTCRTRPFRDYLLPLQLYFQPSNYVLNVTIELSLTLRITFDPGDSPTNPISLSPSDISFSKYIAAG